MTNCLTCRLIQHIFVPEQEQRNIENMSQTNFPISGQQITAIANKAGVSRRYVNMILSNKREANSLKAKKVKEALLVIKASTDKAWQKANEVLNTLDVD